jgi:hypothetical protein
MSNARNNKRKCVRNKFVQGRTELHSYDLPNSNSKIRCVWWAVALNDRTCSVRGVHTIALQVAGDYIIGLSHGLTVYKSNNYKAKHNVICGLGCDCNLKVHSESLRTPDQHCAESTNALFNRFSRDDINHATTSV